MRTQRKMRDLYKVERQRLREGIRLAKPDLLHAHWTYEFALACLDTELPVLVTSHDNALQQLRFSRDLFRLGQLCIQVHVIRKTRFLTAVSPYLAGSLRWLTPAEIAVVPNPVEAQWDAANRFQQASGSIRIATVLNGWGNRKNPKAAIKAFSLLRRELPVAELFMYGVDFEEGGIAAQWATSQGLYQNIHFRGFLPPHTLHKELQEMSLLLHPSREESFGMAILEAMAIGLPVVAGSDAGGVSWVLDNGRAGFLTDVRDARKIAQTLLACIEQTEDRVQKQHHAYNRARRLFSPHVVADQYETLYEKVLACS